MKIMYRGLLAGCITVIAGLSLTAQDQTGTVTKPKTAEQEVRAVITKWADAVKRRDIATLDRMFANDLFITDTSGATRGKEEEPEILKPSPTTRTMSVTNERSRFAYSEV